MANLAFVLFDLAMERINMSIHAVFEVVDLITALPSASELRALNSPVHRSLRRLNQSQGYIWWILGGDALLGTGQLLRCFHLLSILIIKSFIIIISFGLFISELGNKPKYYKVCFSFIDAIIEKTKIARK